MQVCREPGWALRLPHQLPCAAAAQDACQGHGTMAAGQVGSGLSPRASEALPSEAGGPRMACLRLQGPHRRAAGLRTRISPSMLFLPLISGRTQPPVRAPPRPEGGREKHHQGAALNLASGTQTPMKRVSAHLSCSERNTRAKLPFWGEGETGQGTASSEPEPLWQVRAGHLLYHFGVLWKLGGWEAD